MYKVVVCNNLWPHPNIKNIFQMCESVQHFDFFFFFLKHKDIKVSQNWGR